MENAAFKYVIAAQSKCTGGVPSLVCHHSGWVSVGNRAFLDNGTLRAEFAAEGIAELAIELIGVDFKNEKRVGLAPTRSVIALLVVDRFWMLSRIASECLYAFFQHCCVDLFRRNGIACDDFNA